METMEQEGIHRVRVPATLTNAIAIVVVTAGILLEWPWLRWVAIVSLGVGLLAAGGLIAWRRRAGRAPVAARLNFPADER
jgi:hypothetical protein